MMKLAKKVLPIVALFAALIGAVVLVVKFWDMLLLVVVQVKERIDAVLKSLLPNKPEKNDMSDYDDI